MSPFAALLATVLLGSCGGGSDAPPVAHFSVTSIASGVVLAGAPLSVTVTALDANNAVVTGFGGSIRVTSTSGRVLVVGGVGGATSAEVYK